MSESPQQQTQEQPTPKAPPPPPAKFPLDAADSLSVKIQPFKDADGAPVYYAYVSSLNLDNAQVETTFRSHSQHALINLVNDEMRSNLVVLSRLASGELTDEPEPPEEETPAPTQAQEQTQAQPQPA